MTFPVWSYCSMYILASSSEILHSAIIFPMIASSSSLYILPIFYDAFYLALNRCVIYILILSRANLILSAYWVLTSVLLFAFYSSILSFGYNVLPICKTIVRTYVIKLLFCYQQFCVKSENIIEKY